MKKFLFILVVSLFLNTNSFAGKAKPGSGPLTFTEKEVSDFHIYITKKLNSKAMKEYGVPGFSFNRSEKGFYANHYIIKGTYKSIFQWDSRDVNIGPEKGLCSSPTCKIFAKKNKIVWKGAKTKIPRDISISELKMILKDLGFFDGSLNQNGADKKTGKVSKSTTETKKVNNKIFEGERAIALKWDGYSDLIAGKLTFKSSQRVGKINLSLPNNDGQCQGSYTLSEKMGTWSILCKNEMSASGTLIWNMETDSVTGKGVDTKNKTVQFTVSGK